MADLDWLSSSGDVKIPGPAIMVRAYCRVRPEWMSSTVVGLMRHITATCEWSQFPILADALQDAGCDDEEMLTMMRHRVYDPENLSELAPVWREFYPIPKTEGSKIIG